ncbi:MAG: hypothetical protein U5L45_07210 [Saprospiraceae bacterium]|nr:hypothetical protein [Saprospiraceae bacterium]
MLRRAVGSTDFVAADFNPPKMYIPFSLRAVGSVHKYLYLNKRCFDTGFR